MKHQTQSDIAHKLGEVKTHQLNYWEKRKRVMELAEMDNQSMVGCETHESY